MSDKTNIYAEVHRSCMFGPAVEPAIAGTYDRGLLAGVTIGGWKAGDGDGQGTSIAQVLMSVHGDIITSWHDDGARTDGRVQEAVREARDDLVKLFKSLSPSAIYQAVLPELQPSMTVQVASADPEAGARTAVYVKFNTRSAGAMEIFGQLLEDAREKLGPASADKLVREALDRFNTPEASGSIMPDPCSLRIEL